MKVLRLTIPEASALLQSIKSNVSGHRAFGKEPSVDAAKLVDSGWTAHDLAISLAAGIVGPHTAVREVFTDLCYTHAEREDGGSDLQWAERTARALCKLGYEPSVKFTRNDDGLMFATVTLMA